MDDEDPLNVSDNCSELDNPDLLVSGESEYIPSEPEQASPLD